MTNNSNIYFEHNHVFINSAAWQDLNNSKDTFALRTTFNMIKDVVDRNGSVKILMPDDNGISRSADRPSEVQELLAEVNECREKHGLETVPPCPPKS